MEKRLFLLDGHALVYRAHFAFINRPLINSKGLNTSAIAGFTRTLWDLIQKENPSHVAVAFDRKEPTFRHEIYPEYKANREAQPEDITIALEHIKEIIQSFKIPIVSLARYEADDVIGTLAKQAEKEGFVVYMVTPDKDYAQLVSDRVFMYKPGRRGGDVDILGRDEILEKWDINHVDQVIDVLGLQGDSSDNIPGVAGVGPKTASKLLQQYRNIEEILDNVDHLKGSLKTKMENGRESAKLSKTLATINTDAPIQFDAEAYKLEEFDRSKLVSLFRELEFRTLAKNVLESIKQPTLFDDTPKDSPPQKKAKTPAPSYSIASNSMRDHKKEYTLVLSEEDWSKMLKEMMAVPAFALDTETSGLDTIQDELVGISLSSAANTGYYIPLPEDRVAARKAISRLSPLLESEEHLVIGQNIKFDLNFLRQYGFDIAGRLFDTMIAHYLLEPDMRHNLDRLSETYLNYKMIPIQELIGKKGKGQSSMRDVPLEKIRDYAAEDADITFQLYELFLPKLKEAELLDLFDTIEMPLVKVLSQMEINGVSIDADFLLDYSTELGGWIDALERDIQKDAGSVFKVSSPKQVGEVLFDRLQLPYRWKKNASGTYSTSEEKLSELAPHHPIVERILDYRKYTKLKSTYVDALPKLVKPKTNRIHSSFNQARAATGRLSSEHPNLQNIPIRDAAGRKIRNAFVPRQEGNLLLAADYSQIELRLIAHLSQDAAMLEAFQKGQDIHRATAARVYNVEYDEVSADQRRNAKTVNFSIIYGAGATNLSRQLDLSRQEAKALIDSYFAQFGDLKKYMDDNVAFAREHGYVMTLMGRKRHLRDIDSRNGMLRSNAERMAINTPVQGTAADMIKIAMIKINSEMKDKNMKSLMILQVHDELVFDVVQEELEPLKTLVEKNMKNAIPNLNVPIVVSMDTGHTWLEAH